MKKKLLFLQLLLLSLFIMTACGKRNNESTEKDTNGLKIITSFYPVYAMTKVVSGELNDISMIKLNSDIHSSEPSARGISAVFDSDLFIYHSSTLESWVKNIDSNTKNSKVKTFEASKDLNLLTVEGIDEADFATTSNKSSMYDPHTWTDPIMVSQETMDIAKELSKLDPKNKEIYMNNAENFKKEAEKITSSYKFKFKYVQNKKFVTQHTAFAYLAKRFDLTQLGISGISPEQEPSTYQLKEIKDFIVNNNIKVIFYEENISPKTAKTVARGTNTEIKKLRTLETPPKNNNTYLENIEMNLKTLYENLK